MNKTDFINTAFEQLRVRRVIRTKKEFADALGVNYSGLIQAMNGDPRYLTDSLIKKVEKMCEGTDGALLTEKGAGPPTVRPGSIVIPPELAQMFTDLAATVRSQQETISRLTSASAGGVEKKNA